MIYNLDRVPKPTDPQLTDKAIVQLQDLLALELPWLNHAFGRAQRLITENDRGKFIFPAVHIKNGEYQSVMPDSSLGNFSFFVIDDPQQLKTHKSSLSAITSDFSLIVWGNLEDILGEQTDRNSECIKRQVIKAITDCSYLLNCEVELLQVYEDARNIYKGYSINEVQTQFLTQPYYGLKIEGTLKQYDEC